MKYRTGWISIVVVTMILAAMLCGTWQENQKGIEEIPIKAEIEKQREVMEVEKIEYKFIEMEHVGLGGAGAGGLGGVPIIPGSAQQFINLTAPDELVFICFQLSDDKYILTKTYKASANRTDDLLIYKNTYKYEKSICLLNCPIGFPVKIHGYTTEAVNFRWSNIWILFFVSAIIIILGTMLLHTIWRKIE